MRRYGGYNTTMRCYDCQQNVRDLRNHGCPGKKNSLFSTASNFKSTVRCYDCNEQVVDLKLHRQICPRSRKNKSIITSVSTYSTPISNITSFSSVVPMKETGVTLFSLIDVSGSMSGSKLDTAKKAVSDFFQIMDENDRFAIVAFDTNPFFKLKPRSVGQVRRQGELDGILGRIFASGGTALYDAIFLTIDQIHSKDLPNAIVVLTDGMDNASRHTMKEVMDLLEQFPKVTLDIIHVDNSMDKAFNIAYENICKNRGEYIVIPESQILEVVTKVYVRVYNRSKT